MLSWGMVAVVLAAGGAGGATHSVEYSVEVRGTAEVAEVYVRYIDGDGRLVTQEITGSAWNHRVAVDPERTDDVRVLVAAEPTGPAPALSCVLVVDGVERVRDSAVGTVGCRFELADLQPSSSAQAPPPPPPSVAEPPGDEAAIWSPRTAAGSPTPR